MRILNTIFLAAISVLTAQAQTGLSVVKLNDLSFGTDFGGRVKELTSLGSGAAKFVIHSEKDVQVLVTVVLPSAFTSTAGSDAVPIAFDERSAAWSTKDESSSRVVFDPRRPLLLSVQARQNIYVWIGGTVSPTPVQRAGIYHGSITLFVRTQSGN
jgi:hypothetical protein